MFELKPERSTTRAGRVLITTTFTDSHTWNLVYLALATREMGLHSRVLGPSPTESEVTQAVRSFGPDVVVVSSLNGHAHLEAGRLLASIRRGDIAGSAPVIIGGLLGTSPDGIGARRELLKSMGFYEVYEGNGLGPDSLSTAVRGALDRTEAPSGNHL